ncbi:hypothetical protein UFOVP221_35 [uncultured Caudovirales phage]|uniref:Uncharacterized protein n=1 Tax=uncultured Caudovirales phage TaxID=2100421 RepID=A0A6J7WN30_9CAUD|nr:hypothetical protein UFOVP221_35 [uncultured Caudovirales phage]
MTNTTASKFGVWSITPHEVTCFRSAYLSTVDLANIAMAEARDYGKSTTTYSILSEQWREAEHRLITWVHAYAIGRDITFAQAFGAFLKAIGH